MINFNQSKVKDLTLEGEAVRLSNELRYKKAYTVTKVDNTKIRYKEKWGFDCETSDISDFRKWLSDNTIQKSYSLFWFTIRMMLIRFPQSKDLIKKNITKKRLKEFNHTALNIKNNIEWLGETGFINKQKKIIKDKFPELAGKEIG